MSIIACEWNCESHVGEIALVHVWHGSKDWGQFHYCETAINDDLTKGFTVEAVNECDHDWRASRDWMGDPSIPNGTMSWTVWTCRKCDDETTEEPEGWEDPRELDADYERDRRMDDKLTGDL